MADSPIDTLAHIRSAADNIYLTAALNHKTAPFGVA